MTNSIPIWHQFQQAVITKSPTWDRVFLYCLAFFSTFSISGSEASVVGLYLICLLNVMVNRHYWQVPVAVWCAILLFILCVLVSSFLSPYSKGVGAALLEHWRLILPFVLYLSFAQLNLSRWLNYFSAFLCLIALYGIIQFFTGMDWLRLIEEEFKSSYRIGKDIFFRARGNFSHALTYGGYLLLWTPLMATLALCTEFSAKLKKWYYAVVLTMIGAIIFSMSRSVWLGLIIASCVVSFRISRKIPLLLVVAGAIFFSLMLILYSQTGTAGPKIDSHAEFFWQRFSSSFIPEKNQERLYIWQTGWNAIQDYPLFGIGVGNRGEVMALYREPISKITGYRFITKSDSGIHNMYLEIWVYGGLFSLLSYLLIWFLIIRQNWIAIRSTREWSFYPSILLGGTASIIGFLVAGFFENNFSDGEVQIAVMLIIGICLYSQMKIRQTDAEKVDG